MQYTYLELQYCTTSLLNYSTGAVVDSNSRIMKSVAVLRSDPKAFVAMQLYSPSVEALASPTVMLLLCVGELSTLPLHIVLLKAQEKVRGGVPLASQVIVTRVPPTAEMLRNNVT